MAMQRTFRFILPALALIGAICPRAALSLQATEAPRDSAEIRRDSVDARGSAEWALNTYRTRVREELASGDPSPRDFRPAVIARLDELAVMIPGDDYILGHRVGFRVEYGLVLEALRLLSDCQATPWWCSALRGFVLHRMTDFQSAESAFDEALAGMSDDERCAWFGELAYVASGSTRAAMQTGSCDEHAVLDARVWWLSDPLHMDAANDRRTEHLSRLVAMRRHHNFLANGFDDCIKMHHPEPLRFGWTQTGSAGSPAIPGDATDFRGFRFIPAPDIVAEPLSPEHGVWGVASENGGDERYRPHYGPFSPLDQQTGFLARGDSLLVVSVANTALSRLADAASLTAGVVLSRGPDDQPVMRLDETAPGTHRFVATVPHDAWLVSVEALATGHGAARARFGHRIPERAGDFGLSDILLFDWDDDAGEQFDDVLPRMLGTTRLERDRSLGIYWEVYGVDRDDDIQITLGVTPHKSGLLRRLGESLRLVGRRDGVGVEWQEQTSPSEIVTRTLQVDLRTLDRGRYTLELQARDGTGATVFARRDIEIL